MKVIDLLNKIANREITEIPRFIFEGKCYNQCNNIEDINIFKTYYYTTDKETEYTTLGYIFDIDNLNNEITIEEDKKIEKIEKLYKYIDKEVDEKEKDMYYENILKVYDDNEYEIDESISFIVDKINEIIDYLEEKE